MADTPVKSSLGLRWCKNHPEVPLILVARRGKAFWACEADGGQCQYTENAYRPHGPVVAVNGRDTLTLHVRGGRRSRK